MKTPSLLSLTAGAALASAFTFPALATTGTLTGRVTLAEPVADGTKVVYEGEKPEMKPLVIEADKAKDCGTVDTADQSLILGPNGGIANVVITVAVADAKPKALEAPLKLDQKTCRYEPHVTVIPVGSTVDYHNSDVIGHNVHVYAAKNGDFNQTVGAGSKETKKYEHAEVVTIKCDIHPWMNAYLVVVDTPFYAVSGADGSFEIKGLPAGEHKAKLWHEKLGKTDANIKVGADGKVEALEVKMGAKKEGGRKR